MASLYPLKFNEKLAFFYNTVAATLWFCCLGRFLILLPLVGRKFLPGGMADFFHVVSLLPIIESLFVKSVLRKKFTITSLWGILNGLKMVWLCYGVIFPHPKIAKHTSYSLLITSWCLQYFIHYFYYAFKVKTKSSFHFLFWLEYNNFYLTYPLGLVSEMILLFLSLAFVEQDSIYDYVLRAAFLAYIPIAYFAWGHLKSRKKKRYTEIMNKRNVRQVATLENTTTGTKNTSIELRNM